MATRKRSSGTAYRRKNQIKASPEVQAMRDESAIGKIRGSIKGIGDAAEEFFRSRGRAMPPINKNLGTASGFIGRCADDQPSKRWVSRAVR